MEVVCHLAISTWIVRLLPTFAVSHAVLLHSLVSSAPALSSARSALRFWRILGEHLSICWHLTSRKALASDAVLLTGTLPTPINSEPPVDNVSGACTKLYFCLLPLSLQPN
ncbi:hypothetical protein L227DRAFT_88392 [Lentinus tigrinus ALCF2SS1-6]|uniref:Uncharacterized protein n=1 Tax=Lentinus tigrinus ALCF2SS1-6 TaxID=1328759 RepID=A0A5C2SB43_9APHY|nr:hypothetical protein L227DRAFT_88392 [Lentinus tigrinus ALCF2SS1-6]